MHRRRVSQVQLHACNGDYDPSRPVLYLYVPRPRPILNRYKARGHSEVSGDGRTRGTQRGKRVGCTRLAFVRSFVCRFARSFVHRIAARDTGTSDGWDCDVTNSIPRPCSCSYS